MPFQKKAQVALFVIIAIVIIAVTLLIFFVFRARVAPLPSNLQPVESYFKDCIGLKLKEAVQIAGLQGGYIELPEFEAGSSYMPFSNQLNFLGISLPYWFYVSGNNIAKEQKPDLQEIERQFSKYLKEKIRECDFAGFRTRGYLLNFSGEPKVEVVVKTSSIETTVLWPLSIGFGDETATISEHKVSIKSNFGSLFDDASAIFNYQQEKIFLENYSLDVLRLYAPVDGIELSCAPKIWQKSQIENDIKKALEANLAFIKIKGSDYSLTKLENRYFVVDIGKNIGSNVNFLYNPSWSLRFELWPSEDGFVIAEPIGIQPGLGILSAFGFCYVPYHFVYDLYFPVVIQLTKGDELFQFPVVVVIDKTQARNASVAEVGEVVLDICQYKTQDAIFYSYDENLNPVEADVYFKCFNQICSLGKTKMKEGKAMLEAKVPRCYNGFIIARAPDFKEEKIQFTTTEPFVSNLFLAPLHELEIELPDLKTGEYALISFSSSDHSFSIYYPEQKRINLSEGKYNVSVYAFKESSITLESQKGEICVKLPSTGIAGIFGGMEEQCFEVEVPQQSFTNVLFGGGKTSFAITESELKGKSKLSIEIEKFSVPRTLNELTDVYESIDIAQVNVQFE
ncbi:MAG: hypothetical protein N3G19_00220 [Candidatus Pacearchaeota archaeon]|nr:hypothetical protein [Candidatus Pacearchaeota archaeon]